MLRPRLFLLLRGFSFLAHAKDPDFKIIDRAVIPERFAQLEEVLRRLSPGGRSWLLRQASQNNYQSPKRIKWTDKAPANPDAQSTRSDRISSPRTTP